MPQQKPSRSRPLHGRGPVVGRWGWRPCRSKILAGQGHRQGGQWWGGGEGGRMEALPHSSTPLSPGKERHWPAQPQTSNQSRFLTCRCSRQTCAQSIRPLQARIAAALRRGAGLASSRLQRAGGGGGGGGSRPRCRLLCVSSLQGNRCTLLLSLRPSQLYCGGHQSPGPGLTAC